LYGLALGLAFLMPITVNGMTISSFPTGRTDTLFDTLNRQGIAANPPEQLRTPYLNYRFKTRALLDV
jgi:hypothetical protein